MGPAASGITVLECIRTTEDVADNKAIRQAVRDAGRMIADGGAAGFLALSKEKPVLRQSALSGVSLLYPPYGRLATWMLKLLGRLG